MALMRVCCYPGCSCAVPEGERYCEEHRLAAAAQPKPARISQRDERARESSAARGYGHAWRKARAAFLKRHPLCVRCQQRGQLTAATDVDHIKPHRGDKELFWDSANWQPLCHVCHSEKTSREDGGGWRRREQGAVYVV